MGVVALFHFSYFILVCVFVVGEVGCIDVGFNESKEFVCVCVCVCMVEATPFF